VAKAIWKKALHELKEWMTAEQSDPQIIHDIIHGLKAWYDDTDPPDASSTANQQS